jgi:type IV pilus assembly protein PilQ
MKYRIDMKSVKTFGLCLLLSTSVIVGTALAADTKKVVKAPVLIQSVQMKGEGAAAELVVSASVPTTYTSYKTTIPNRLVIDFSQASPADGLTTIQINKGPVKDVSFKSFETDAGILTRMEVFLTQDLDPRITPSADKPGELVISFPGFKQPELRQLAQPESKPVEVTQPEVSSAVEQPQKQTEPPVPVATTPDGVVLLVTTISVNAGAIEIGLSGPVSDYKTFRLNKPERVVVDIPNAKIGAVEKLVQLNSAGVSTARVGSYPDKVRVVFDSMNGSLPDTVIEKTASGLRVQFGQAGIVTPVTAAQATDVVKSSSPETPLVPAKKTSIDKTTAEVAAIDFQALEGVSRVVVKISGSPQVDAPVKAAGTLSFRIKNAQLPRNLQRSLETREFNSPVLRVTPVQVKTKSGNDVLIRVTLKSEQPFELRKDADLIILDVKHPAEMTTSKVSLQKNATVQKASASATTADQLDKVVEQVKTSDKKLYSGRKVTLEFADAEVRKIFQLLSEVSNKNFVLGDEVTGTISLKLVNVPWDQALDIILDTKGLDKREQGNIVLIRGKGKFKSLLDEESEIRKATLKNEPLETAMLDVNYADLGSIVSQFTAIKTERGMITQDQRTNKVIIRDVKTAIADMRNILKSLDVPEKQVMIEARIVEASTTFTQSLGVNWGIHYRDGSAAIAGINSMDTSFGGLASNVAPTTGVSGNPGATAGISFGTLSSNIQLDMRLNAAVSAGLVRIVSTPKVATLNHKSAKITQGQQIPYTSSTSDKIETKFVEAALSLEVTPHINPNGTVIMKIDAKNDAPGTGNPPPINKKEATTEMMLRDGETTVIGGIYVESESSGDDGVPYLLNVPFLGSLFKSTDTKRSRSELLIFITPRIISSSI